VGDDLDLWTFNIEEVVLSQRGNRVDYRTLHINLSTGEFLKWVSDASLQHYQGQAQGDNYLKRVSESAVCGACGVMKLFCRCVNKADDVPELVPDDDDDDEIDPEVPPAPARPALVREQGSVDPRYHVPEIQPVSDIVPQARSIVNYTSSGILVFSAVQMGILSIFLYRLSNEPVKWFWRLWIQKGIRDSVGDGLEIGPLEDANSYKALLWRFMNNFYQFDAIDSALLMWLNGWNKTSNWLRQSAIKIRNAVHENPKIIAGFVVVITASVFLMWFWSTASIWSIDVQGGDIPQGVKPPKPDVNIENTWKASQKLGINAFLTEQSKTGSPEWFSGYLETATAHLQFNHCKFGIIGLNVFGQYWMIPKHFANTDLFRKSTFVHLTRACSPDAKFASYYGAVDMKTMITDENSDFVLLKINTQPGVNLIPYMVEPRSGTRLSAKALFVRAGMPAITPVDPITFGETEYPSVSVLNGMNPMFKYSGGQYKNNFETLNGDCGSPIFVSEKGRLAILGIHVGTMKCDPTIKYTMNLPITWLKKVFESDAEVVVQGHLDTEKLDGKKIAVSEDIHSKCPLRFEGLSDIELGNSAVPIGSFVGLAMNRLGTKVKENLYAAFWKSKGYVCSKVRPVLSAVGVPSWMPKRNFLLNACQHKDLIPYDILDKVAAHYLLSFVTRTKESDIEKCVIIDEETNLYGADDNNFISHMKFDTGAGFPHNKPKYAVLDRVTHPKFPDGTCAIPAAMRRKIDAMEGTAAKGERINLVFNSSLKDEPISQTKLEAGKIRVFQAICVEGLYLLRKYFLSIIAYFQTWNFASEAAIGMDATGPDWDDIHDHIFKDGWKVFCGDYSNYDQRMGSSIMMKAWWILIEIARMSGNYPSVAVRIMWVLAVECCYCTVNFFGDLICLNGSNPSGHGLTVVINSICNSLYMRVAYYDIIGSLDGFSIFVRLMTYGDDNIISVHPAMQEKFNQVTVTKALAKYGIVYTDAQKTGAAAKPFCDENEISFLKRGFVKSPYGFWLAPLEVASIHKMLIIGVDSGKSEEKDRLAGVLISSVMEAFQHGEEFYNSHVELVKECMVEYQLVEWVELKGGLPTFQSLLDKRFAKMSRASLLAK